MKKDKYIWGFQIVGSDCGYDEFGTFHCACGHCLPLRVDVSKGGKYRGSDCGDGRYDGENMLIRNRLFSVRAFEPSVSTSTFRPFSPMDL